MIRHAKATHILLEVQRNAQIITFNIQDNGNGFDTSTIKESTGLGWKNIAARVNMLGGELQVRSERLSGTQIEISIPGI